MLQNSFSRSARLAPDDKRPETAFEPSPFDPNCLGALAACRWSGQMLRMMREGVSRPGAMRRQLPGLSQKVQSVCLHKMTRFGLLQREAFPEIPPRVEYTLTPRGQEFTALLDGIENLQRHINGEG